MQEYAKTQEVDTAQIEEKQMHFTDTKDAIRAGLEDFIRVNFDETGFLSAAEAASQRQYVNSVLNDPNVSEQKLQQLKEDYLGTFAEKSKSENIRLYFNEVVGPLKNALEDSVISADSYRKWIDWFRDPARKAKEKKSSISSALPEYLQDRRALAAKRSALIKDPRVHQLTTSSDPRLKSLAVKVTDTDYFLNALSFAEREKVLTELTAALPLGAQEENIFTNFSAQLTEAVSDGLITEESKKKWIARFKDPAVGLKAKIYFVSSQFPSYVAAWKDVKANRKKLLDDSVVKQLSAKEAKDIVVFTDDKKFLALHYDRKVSLIAEVRAGRDALEKGKLALHTETKNVLETAATAGYIGANKVGPWLEHVISGKRTLAELKNFVKDWAKVRYRFDKVEGAMMEGKVPQGLQRISRDTFLNLSYQQRLSYVNEAERRLHIESNDMVDTPIQDVKGKIRHAMDTENWEEAQYYLSKAWPLAKTSEDIAELQSMETFVRSFGTKAESSTEDAGAEVRNAQQEITEILRLLPVGLQPLYRKALAKGPECVQCVTTCVYNRTWCEERGYLTESLEEDLREKSLLETQNRLRAGGEGHADGLENNFVDGFHQPAIRDSGVGPQNVFMSSSGADSFVEKADANKNTFTFWYWTNLIVDGVSSSQNSYVSYNLNWRIKKAARTLQKHGLRYNPVINIAGPSNPSLN